jgi:hemolysin activation/secretion protein
VPLYAAGTVIGASYTRSDVVGNFGSFSSTGAGRTFGLNFTRYLAPKGGRRSYVTLGLDDREFDASRINDIIVPGALDRRSRPISLGYTARTESDTAVWGYTTEIAWNTGTGAHDDLASYQSEDPRIRHVHWKAIRGSASYTAPLAQTWLWSLRGNFQYSPDVLISGEQFGLGGLTSVRGTEIERPISADKGLSATLEITTPELIAGLRALGFVDAGYVWNNDPDGLNKPGSDRLASVGLGLRYAMGPFVASLDYGRLVVGSRVPLSVNSAAPQNGEDRWYVNLGMRF